MTMPDACPDCGHRITLHFEDEFGVFRCSVATCDCSDDEDED